MIQRATAKRIPATPFNQLSKLARQIVSTFGGQEPGKHRVRRAAKRLGMATSLNLDEHWLASQQAPKGPIDVIDIFSGCGGMSAGFLAINGAIPTFNLVAGIDIDPIANSTYERNLGVPSFDLDVSFLANQPRSLARLISSSARREDHPLVLIGCAPCQGFSSHRNRAGQKDPRNSLFVDFARIGATLKPDAIVIENVPELLTNKYWPFIRESKGILKRAGYSVYVGVHNMAEFGVPQERFRAVMLALRKPFQELNGFVSRSEFRTVRDSIGKLPPIVAGERCEQDPMHYSAGHKKSTLRTIRAVPKNGGNRPFDVGPECLRRGKKRQGKAMYEDVYGRLYWDRPSITITASARNPASGRFVHPDQDRGLSVREAALLQGFPSGYLFDGGLDERFRQIGNAVPPAFASYLASYIVGELLAPDGHGHNADEMGILEPVGQSFSRLIPSLKRVRVAIT
jgi:DNA (cytosine-5)-methyltransferase 1